MNTEDQFFNLIGRLTFYNEQKLREIASLKTELSVKNKLLQDLQEKNGQSHNKNTFQQDSPSIQKQEV